MRDALLSYNQLPTDHLRGNVRKRQETSQRQARVASCDVPGPALGRGDAPAPNKSYGNGGMAWDDLQTLAPQWPITLCVKSL